MTSLPSQDVFVATALHLPPGIPAATRCGQATPLLLAITKSAHAGVRLCVCVCQRDEDVA